MPESNVKQGEEAPQTVGSGVVSGSLAHSPVGSVREGKAGTLRPATTYQICTKCVMDTSDPKITFDEEGVCSHCHGFAKTAELAWFRGDEGRQQLERLATKIRRKGAGKPYDIVIGVSGGVDSSYLLHMCKVELGLRPLAVHVDAGWNSELAVANIEKIVSKLDIDLYTHVVDWEEMRDLQVAYLRSGIANQDVPQDHIFPAEVYRAARRLGVRHIANGANLATESILPKAWGYDSNDDKQILAIHRQFGESPLRTYKTMSLWEKRIYFPYVYGIKIFYPLNYIEYNKNNTIRLLEEEYGWSYYGGKHYESRWTQFFQSYYLPRRFGYDKRRAHLASLVVTGEISRADALEQLQSPPYDANEIEAHIDFICNKLRISRQEFEYTIQQPLKDFSDYPNYQLTVNILRRVFLTLSAVKRMGASLMGGVR